MHLSGDQSIYLQIKEQIENSILYGSLKEEDRAPSMNELSNVYAINPATAGKGLNLLVDTGVLYKKRGIGMFVSTGAKAIIIEERKKKFYEHMVFELIKEADLLGVSENEIKEMIHQAKTEKKNGAEAI